MSNSRPAELRMSAAPGTNGWGTTSNCDMLFRATDGASKAGIIIRAVFSAVLQKRHTSDSEELFQRQLLKNKGLDGAISENSKQNVCLFWVTCEPSDARIGELHHECILL